MEGLRIDASVLVTMTTIAIALVGLFFQGVKLSSDRAKDREERAGQMAKTDAKLDELMRSVGDLAGRMAAMGERMSTMAIAQTRIAEQVDDHERRISAIEGEHKSNHYQQ